MSNPKPRYRTTLEEPATHRDVRHAVRELLRLASHLGPGDGSALVLGADRDLDLDEPVGGPEQSFWNELVELVRSYDAVTLGAAGTRRVEMGDLRAVAAAEDLADLLRELMNEDPGDESRDAERICDLLEGHGFITGEDVVVALLEAPGEARFASFAEWTTEVGGPMKAAKQVIKVATHTGEKTLDALSRLRTSDEDDELQMAVEERLAGFRAASAACDESAMIFAAQVLRDPAALRAAERTFAVRLGIVSSFEEEVSEEDLGSATQPAGRVAQLPAEHSPPWGHDADLERVAYVPGPLVLALDSGLDALRDDVAPADPFPSPGEANGPVPEDRDRGVDRRTRDEPVGARRARGGDARHHEGRVDGGSACAIQHGGLPPSDGGGGHQAVAHRDPHGDRTPASECHRRMEGPATG